MGHYSVDLIERQGVFVVICVCLEAAAWGKKPKQENGAYTDITLPRREKEAVACFSDSVH